MRRSRRSSLPPFARASGAAACTRLALGAALLLSPLATARAQPAGPGEFTKQGLLVLSFARDSNLDGRIGRQAGDAVRGRIDRLANGRELDVIGGAAVRERLQSAGFTGDEAFEAAALGHIAKSVRADEYLVGRVRRTPGGVRLEADLRLVRDPHTRHPLPAATGADVGEAAARLAQAVIAARQQLAPDRRCRNALREGRAAQAVAASRAAIAGGADGAFIRSCHAVALGVAGAPLEERLQAARAALAIDSTSRLALESAGRTTDLLRRREDAARYWLAFAATDTTDYLLASQASYALLDGGNARAVLPLVARALRIHADSVGLVRIQWLAARELRDVPLAITAGERLLADDPAIAKDSTFLGQLAETYRSTAQPFRALELASRGVARFPGDARLYMIYTQLVLAERDTVVPRGLARFPNSAPLHVLAARELKARGQAEEALAATRQAVALDSTLPQGLLAVAQAEYELGRPDSALVSLRRGLARGEDTVGVAQFALAKGNALLRAANQTRARDDLHRALSFLALGDSARPTAPSKLVLGTAALAYAQAVLLELPQARPAARAASGRTPVEAGPAARCPLAEEGARTVALATVSLRAGESAAPDAARQYLEVAGQLGAFADRARASHCAGGPAPAATAVVAPAPPSSLPGDRSAAPATDAPPRSPAPAVQAPAPNAPPPGQSPA